MLRFQRRFLLLPALLSVTVCLTGCGPADKQAAVRDARHAVDSLQTRTGSVSLTITPEQGPGANSVANASAGSLGATAGLVLDPASHSAALLAPAGLPATLRGNAITLFDGTVIYSRTADGDVVGARPWFRLDSAQLGGLNHYSAKDLARPTNLGDLVAFNPLTVIDQVLGLLTGSVRISRNATVTAPGTGQAVPAIEYDGNSSLDKVARQRHVDPDRLRPTRSLLGIYAITQDINPLAVWLSTNGELIRVRVSYVSQPLKRVRFHVIYDLTLDPSQPTQATRAPLAAPSSDEVVDVGSLGQLALALTNLGRTGVSS